MPPRVDVIGGGERSHYDAIKLKDCRKQVIGLAEVIFSVDNLPIPMSIRPKLYFTARDADAIVESVQEIQRDKVTFLPIENADQIHVHVRASHRGARF